jgi:hypothetical protein
MKFERNVGLIDRILRAGIGAAMIYVGFLNPTLVADHVARMVLGGMGVIMIVVATVGICPMYSAIGFTTAPAKGR